MTEIYIDPDTGATVDADWWPGDPIEGKKMANEGDVVYGRSATESRSSGSVNGTSVFVNRVGSDIHATLAKLESELLNLPDYATAKFKALLAELKGKL